MNCPRCGRQAKRPAPGTVWRYCEHCRGWFYWDASPVQSLIVDVLETWPGVWFTLEAVNEKLQDLRPGLSTGAVSRAFYRLRSQRQGWAADRLETVDGDGVRRARRRPVLVQASTGAGSAIRVQPDDYWSDLCR